MPSKISFFNRGIFCSNIKRFWLITFSYTLFLLFFVLDFLNADIYLESKIFIEVYVISIFGRSRDLMTIFLGFYTLIPALAIFSYMHFQKNTAMIHSLPLRRDTLFVTNYLSGLFIASFPLIFNTAVLLVGTAALGYTGINYILLWFGINMALTFLLYSFAVFAGMFTGHMAAHAIFFYIFNFLAGFLEHMIDSLLSSFFFGYARTSSLFDTWSPLYYLGEFFWGFQRGKGNIAVLAGYIISGLIFLVLAFFLYKKRHMEVATDVISFGSVKPVFKYSVSFCSSILLGSILVSVLKVRHDLFAYIAAYIFGGLIGYFSSEMLLKKTFRVFKAYKGFLVFALVLSLLLLSIGFDFYGFENRIPDTNEIEVMYFYNHYDISADLALHPEKYNPSEHYFIFSDPNIINNPPQALSEHHIKELRKHPGIAESQNAIEKARIIHSYIVENKELLKKTNRIYNSTSVYRHFFFKYKMKDGSILERQYYLNIPDNSTALNELDSLMNDYLSLKEVREKYQPVISIKPSDIRSITIRFYTEEGTINRIAINDIPGFLAAYQSDILAIEPIKSIYRKKEEQVYNLEIEIEYSSNYFDYLRPYLVQDASLIHLTVEYKNTLDFLFINGVISPDEVQGLNPD
jgi:hypothetical protein